MKFTLCAAIAALALTTGTASAQHYGHNHNGPSFQGGYGGYQNGFGGSYYRGGFGNSYRGGGYYGGGHRGPVLVPHTTTHLDLVPHRGHYHVVPHTTTHYHAFPGYRRW